ncbi:glucosamine-6-phosphate deaminase [Caldalkalibacillus mannanilyticus]|uniref:glucosamine-6-phosphate deaminase n=1 Tax=Caldalkalibacillus mannanilyticus TaxID=1418 RepID=UPI00046AA4F8|nr:glucosamine-6-phosphate deaminase [Caldalkalibacillus mannanilyticus]
MQLCVLESCAEVASKAADHIQQAISEKPDSILGLATGSTPIDTYKEIIGRYEQGKIDFSQVRTFNLDEYYGLAADHPQSYHTFMHQQLFQHINVPRERIHIPSGTPIHVQEYCRSYEQFITDCGGIDLQLLGIGSNGHIGFNEPSDQLSADTHLVRLSEATIEANARFFERKEEVPQYAITMGMGTILSAKKILLLALGIEKAEIIRKLFDTGVTTDIPASFLRLHPNVIVLVDREAGSQLVGNIKEFC